ncbi:MAG: TldD/PmbA family protein [Syntrophomonadaceae bacterium]
MQDKLRKAGEKVLTAAKKAGVEAEAFLLFNRELTVEVLEGQVDTLTQADEIGIGLRVINKGRLGFAYTSNLSEPAIKSLVEDAVNISSFTAIDEYNCLPAVVSDYPDLDIYDPQIPATDLDIKLELARLVEQSALKSDSRVKIIEKAGYEEGEYTSLIMNTNGLNAFSRGNYCGLYAFVVGEENSDAQTGFSVMTKRSIKELDPGAVGKEAADNAVRNLNPRTIGSTEMPCVIEPYVMTRFLGILARMVNAGAVQKGKSLLAGRQEQVVGSPVLSITDDATYEGGMASFPFDGEGIPAQKTQILSAGILKNFLYDTYTAKKDGTRSTGNGQRASFRSLPSVGPSNFILEPGRDEPAKLVNAIKRGIYITDVMGVHTANPVSGDFSLGAQGIMIENGHLTYPLRGLTIAGNMIGFLEAIEAVGNDLRFYGGKASPTVLLRRLSIGGE